MPNRPSQGALVLIVMIALAAVSGGSVWAFNYGMSQPVAKPGPQPQSPSGSEAKGWAVHSPGYEGTIEADQDTYAAASRADWDELVKSIRADDGQGRLELMLAERAFILPGGTKVKILDSPFGPQYYEVRVLSGKRTGQRAFVLKKAVW